MRPNILLIISLLVFSGAAQAQSNGKLMATSTSYSPAPKKAKRNVVNLYPNPSTNGTVSVSSNREEELHFYIFDLEGTLIFQATLRNKDKKQVEKLNKGTYMYNVFANDESIEEGKLIIK
ncbi:MAG TPA: T9SS type A sorting domain-containing protein [Flavisolibacter sp.]|jgi:hypothetical protein|nr:T9SS type A sorting domain-containing protein [Flavisolibacter sp.]